MIELLLSVVVVAREWPSRQPTKKIKAITAAMEVAPTPLEDLDILPVHHIVSFVGPNQYRFVAAISKDFKASYCHLFPL
jgi:hypothetical protein